MTSAYVPSTVAATALRNLGDKRIKMVGIDDDPIVLDAIKDGFLVGTMAQNPYGQAYIGAQVLGMLVNGCTREGGCAHLRRLRHAADQREEPDELQGRREGPDEGDQ